MTTREDDEHSLFGSPPPEAAPAISRGRSPSPLLALPGISTATPSLSSTSIASTSALQIPIQHGTRQPSSLISPPTGASQSAQFSSQRSLTPTTRPQRPPRKKRPQKSSATSTRTSTPQIQVPDSSTHLPPNFLRNQSALLGLAGLVGRIKPATLMRGKGTTRNNPIIIDPPEDTSPSILAPDQAVILAELPTLTTEEIVEALVNEKDTLPLLEGILKLHSSLGVHQLNQNASTPQRGTALFYQPSGFQHTAKRRKLDVPAGASDWDVPYPFADGEASEAYRLQWEQERGQRLVKEFIDLVRRSAEEAARKKYLARRGKKSLRHYRRHAAYDEQHQQTGPRNDSPTFVSPSPSVTPAPSQLAATPTPTSLLFDFSNVPELESTSTFPDNHTFNEDFLSNWMSMLDSFPDPSSVGSNQSADPNSLDSAGVVGMDGAGLEDLGLGWLSSLDESLPSAQSGIAMDVAGHSKTSFLSTIPDSMIDPQLWALSTPAPNLCLLSQSQSSNGHQPHPNNPAPPNRPPTPSLSISSLPSLASPHLSQTSLRETPEVVTPSASASGFGDESITPGIGEEEEQASRRDKGKGKETTCDMAMDVDVDQDVLLATRFQPFILPQTLGGSNDVTMLNSSATQTPETSTLPRSCDTSPEPHACMHPQSKPQMINAPSHYDHDRPRNSKTRQALDRTANLIPSTSTDTSISTLPSISSLLSSIASSSSSSSPSFSSLASSSQSSVSLRTTNRFTPQQKQNILREAKERLMLLKAEHERAKVEYWECGLEHACMVQMVKELAKSRRSQG